MLYPLSYRDSHGEANHWLSSYLFPLEIGLAFVRQWLRNFLTNQLAKHFLSNFITKLQTSILNFIVIVFVGHKPRGYNRNKINSVAMCFLRVSW